MGHFPWKSIVESIGAHTADLFAEVGVTACGLASDRDFSFTEILSPVSHVTLNTRGVPGKHGRHGTLVVPCCNG